MNKELRVVGTVNRPRGWMDGCSNPGRDKIFVWSPKRLDRPWDTPSFKFSGYREKHSGSG